MGDPETDRIDDIVVQVCFEINLEDPDGVAKFFETLAHILRVAGKIRVTVETVR